MSLRSALGMNGMTHFQHSLWLPARLARGVPAGGVLAMLQDDLDWELWAARTADEGKALVRRRPYIEAARQALRGLKGHAGLAARRAVVHGAWTEAYLNQVGMAPSADCKACNLADGTRLHRYYQCTAFQQQRWAHLPDQTWSH